MTKKCSKQAFIKHSKFRTINELIPNISIDNDSNLFPVLHKIPITYYLS